MIVRSSEFRVRRFFVKNFFVLISLFISQKNFAQHTIGLGEDQNRVGTREFYTNNIDFHSSIKPFLDVDINGKRFAINDSVTYEVNVPRLCWKNYYQKPWDTASVYEPY